MAVVFYAPLHPETLNHDRALSIEGVIEYSAIRGYRRIARPYDVTDQARNLVVLEFLEKADNPDDVLVMLDLDHLYPPNAVERLADWRKPVIGALYFNRRPPYEPMFFYRHGNVLKRAHKWVKGINECAVVGTGAIAIQRQVFDTLKEHGFEFPWFRYLYTDRVVYRRTEDMCFGECCEKAGIKHYVDGTFILPHERVTYVTEKDFLTEREVKTE